MVIKKVIYGSVIIRGISCRKTDGTFLHFSKNDGLQENEFNTNTSFETVDGELFFGGVNGASSFYPGAVTGVNEKPEVLLTSIMIKDQPLREDSASWSIKKLSIPYFNNVISFTLTAIGNRSADQYNYQYQLSEQDRQWINAGNNSQVRYVLQPGNYIFRYYAGNSFEKNPTEIKELYITITPPFWRTAWFRILAIAAIISLIVIITRRIARRKLKRQIIELQQSKILNEERLRISREMHDDIGAGLTQITLMSEAAKLHQQNIQPLEEIAGTSRKLVGSINEIIWSLNPENQSLAQLLAYLREQLHQLLEYSGINYKIDFPENNEAVILTNAQRRNLVAGYKGNCTQCS
jgi:signal transduction histidine kinase